MRRLVVLTLITAAALVAMAVAQAQRDPAAIQMEKIRDGLYVITGGPGTTPAQGISGNTTVFVTDTGVVLVDTKLPGFSQAILDQVKTVTSKPITMVINTHTHADHVSGNLELPRNVERVAHENTKANMARMDIFKDANAAALPARTYGDRLSLLSGRDRIEVYYFGRGHTSGDAVVVFPALRAAVMGDLFSRKGAPAVDTGNGGNMTAFPDTIAKAASALVEVDTIITGHANTPAGRAGQVLPSSFVMTRADLQEYADFLREFVAYARTSLASGKSVDETLSGWKQPDRYRDYDMTSARADIQRLSDESKR